jgi:hypothetical protein
MYARVSQQQQQQHADSTQLATKSNRLFINPTARASAMKYIAKLSLCMGNAKVGLLCFANRAKK